jgi:hypothetical protein
MWFPFNIVYQQRVTVRLNKVIFAQPRLYSMRFLPLCALLLAGFGLVEKTRAQADFNSMSQSLDSQPYNLKLGPINVRAEASVDTSFSDNINVAKTGRIADISVGPQFNISGLWQVTDLNSLSVDLGIGYQAYIVHPRYSGLTLSPSSEVQFNLFVGDVKINFHDNFSYAQDPLGVGQLSNVSQFARFTNDAGIRPEWDLGDVVLSMGYDHTNFWVFERAFEYLDYQSDSLSPQVSVKVSPTITAGMSTTFSDTRYDQNIQNDSTSLSVGPFVTTQISEYLTANAQAGFYLAQYDKSGLNGDNSNNATIYGSIGLNHRINDVMTESLTAGRESIPGITSNYTERDYANYTATWQATSYMNVGSFLWWENLDDSNAAVRETSNRYGAGFNIGYSLTDHASLSLGYQYVLKVADPSALGYYQNLVTLGFHYQF